MHGTAPSVRGARLSLIFIVPGLLAADAHLYPHTLYSANSFQRLKALDMAPFMNTLQQAAMVEGAVGSQAGGRGGGSCWLTNSSERA